jgi:nickel superoxide dismutase
MRKLLVMLALLFTWAPAWAHCQIPCGIFDDAAQLAAIKQDILTIEKSINEIIRLQQEKPVDLNQVVRWVNNKDVHAAKIQTAIADYFLAQRVKPVSDKNSTEYTDYVKKLTILHEINVAAMKSKQSLDINNVKKMRSLMDELDQFFIHKN